MPTAPSCPSYASTSSDYSYTYILIITNWKWPVKAFWNLICSLHCQNGQFSTWPCPPLVMESVWRIRDQPTKLPDWTESYCTQLYIFALFITVDHCKSLVISVHLSISLFTVQYMVYSVPTVYTVISNASHQDQGQEMAEEECGVIPVYSGHCKAT